MSSKGSFRVQICHSRIPNLCMRVGSIELGPAHIRVSRYHIQFIYLRIHIHFQTILLAFSNFIRHVPWRTRKAEGFTTSIHAAQISGQAEIKNLDGVVYSKTNIVGFEVTKDNILQRTSERIACVSDMLWYDGFSEDSAQSLRSTR